MEDCLVVQWNTDRLLSLGQVEQSDEGTSRSEARSRRRISSAAVPFSDGNSVRSRASDRILQHDVHIHIHIQQFARRRTKTRGLAGPRPHPS